MILRKTILTTSICLVYLISSLGQNPTDSIDQILKKTKEDTSKVNLLLKNGAAQKFNFPDKSLIYFKQALDLAKRIHYPLGIANAYKHVGSYYIDIKNDFVAATTNFQLADSIYHKFKGTQFREGTGAIQHSYGTIQLLKGNYLEAVQYFVKALKILDSVNNKTILPRTYNNLSLIYTFLKQFDKAEYYARACVKLAEETTNMAILPQVNITLAAALIEEKKYDEALPFIFKAKKLAEASKNHNVLELAFLNLGGYYGFYKKDYPKAVENTEKALEYAKILDNQWEESRVLTNLSGFYFSNNQFEKARISASKAYEISHNLKYIEEEYSSLFFQAQAEAHFGDTKKAYDHMRLSWDLKDSTYKQDNQKQINYLESIYQTEKKEKEILKLQNEKQINTLIIKKRNVLIYALFVTIAFLFGFAFLINRSIQTKRVIAEKSLEIQNHKVRELENEKLLSATQSVLKGEESERKRLARDLHDGLGGLLSGIKVALNSMKGNVVLSSENVDAFNQALGMVDNSITELRRVAHNMMPEALMKLGLKDTLTDFCNELGKVNPMRIDFQFYGQFERIESNLEINSYRIIQELVNNAIKHSEAKELVVQMIQESKRLCFIILDNGKGFEMKNIQYLKGVGLASIKSRIDSFNGQLEINSSPGKGTEITVEFQV